MKRIVVLSAILAFLSSGLFAQMNGDTKAKLDKIVEKLKAGQALPSTIKLTGTDSQQHYTEYSYSVAGSEMTVKIYETAGHIEFGESRMKNGQAVASRKFGIDNGTLSCAGFTDGLTYTGVFTNATND